MPASPKIQPQPLIAVRNVRASTRWYEELLEVARVGDSDHGDVYQRLMDGGQLVLQLHSWDDEDHLNLINPGKAPPGHGVLLWFQVADIDSVVERARRLGARIVLGPEVNENSGALEVWIEDPDGYVVVAASADGVDSV